uniref:Uncharacterized protein n=1 Tax=Glossina brevipalpis TaxID=37001 RepID=A0A1A9W6Q7_9MUSC
ITVEIGKHNNASNKRHKKKRKIDKLESKIDYLTSKTKHCRIASLSVSIGTVISLEFYLYPIEIFVILLKGWELQDLSRSFVVTFMLFMNFCLL